VTSPWFLCGARLRPRGLATAPAVDSGYVFAGLILSPFTPGLRVHDVPIFEVMAEIGVILLMFSVGIEFSIPDLLRVKWVALAGAPLGILLSSV